MSASLRLTHLLELAERGPALRAALAEEVAEMLTDWPADCPLEMRTTCEALLAQAARDVDSDTRSRLRVRLFADPELATRVLPRTMPERTLVEAARDGDVAAVLAKALNLSTQTARLILDDKGGVALAVAAKSIGLTRAAYSALAVLTQMPLDAYEQVNAVEAAQQLRDWSAEAHAA